MKRGMERSLWSILRLSKPFENNLMKSVYKHSVKMVQSSPLVWLCVCLNWKFGMRSKTRLHFSHSFFPQRPCSLSLPLSPSITISQFPL